MLKRIYDDDDDDDDVQHDFVDFVAQAN